MPLYNEGPMGPISGKQTRQLTQFYSPDGRQLYSDELGNYAYVKDGTGWFWQFTSDPNDPFSEGGFAPVSPLDQGRLLELNSGDGTGTGSTGRDEAAQDADRAQAEYTRQRAQLEREQLAQEERQNKLNRLIDLVQNATSEREANKRRLTEIQPDFARFAGGLQGLPDRGITPTIAFGNQLAERAALPIPQVDFNAPNATLDQQTQQLVNYNQLPAINAPGMAMGGTLSASGAKFGTGKRGVIVGDAKINGDEELAVYDPQRHMMEVIPIVGRAADGAELPLPYDPASTYGAFSPLYQPFGISSQSAVPTSANTTPTSLGYIAPRQTTDFATNQPAPYGPLSTQYFENVTGSHMLLPNPSTILNELRTLKATNPAVYEGLKSLYANAQTREGRPSGLTPDFLDSMIDVFDIKGRRATPIGIR